MKPLSSPRTRRAFAAVVFAAVLPLIAWAQGSAPPPAQTEPKAAAPAQGSMTMPAAPAQMAAPGAPMLSDSARAVVKKQVERDLKAMADTLKLTPDQRSKARMILLDHGYQLTNLRTKYMAMPRTPENRAAMTKELQSMRDSTDARLGNVLSAEQMTGYKTWRDAQLAKARSKMGGMGAPAGAPAPKPMAPADTTKK